MEIQILNILCDSESKVAKCKYLAPDKILSKYSLVQWSSEFIHSLFTVVQLSVVLLLLKLNQAKKDLLGSFVAS